MCEDENYRAYYQSDEWQKKRDEYLKNATCCDWCEVPRRMVILTYGADLRVRERPKFVEVVCPRCDEIGADGSSRLPEIHPAFFCEQCHKKVWDFNTSYPTLCPRCALRLDGLSPKLLLDRQLLLTQRGLEEGMEMWKYLLRQIIWTVDKDAVVKAAQLISQEFERYPESDQHLIDKLYELPSPHGYVQRLFDEGKTKSLLEKMPTPQGKPN